MKVRTKFVFEEGKDVTIPINGSHFLKVMKSKDKKMRIGDYEINYDKESHMIFVTEFVAVYTVFES